MKNNINTNFIVVFLIVLEAVVLLTIIMALLVSIVVPSVLLSIGFMIENGVFEDYTGWKEVEIPTDSELRARMKIPEEWNFVVEDGKVHIRDSEGNLVATEVYEGYDRGEKDFNENLTPEMLDLDSYEFVLGGENPCFLYKIETDNEVKYFLEMYIMSRTSTAPKIGHICLMMMFEENVDIAGLYPKIQKSYRYGGLIKDGKPDDDK